MIIVGLGNVGKKYEKTRHNTGFMFVDQVAVAEGAKFKLEKDLNALVCKCDIDGKPCVLVKPTTYMNNSGLAVGKVMQYYKASLDELLVVYDDMDLPVGTLRIRKLGGSGGHNGMKSIIEVLNSENFARIRIGIGHPEEDTIDYVLGKFNRSDAKLMKEKIEQAPLMVKALLDNGLDYLMNNFNK